jgi:hypothetical protein
MRRSTVVSCASLLALALLSGCVTTQSASVSRPRVTADQLMGQESQAVQVALGQPRRVRKEAPAEIWQYDGGSCVVDLFLYPEGGKQKVTHLEARDSTSGKTVDTNACLAKLNGVATS